MFGRWTDFSLHDTQDVKRDDIDTAPAACLRPAVALINELKHAAVKELKKDAGPSFPSHKTGGVMTLNGNLQELSELSL